MPTPLRPLLLLVTALLLTAPLPAVAQNGGPPANAPKTTPAMLDAAWNRVQGDGTNLAYVMQAADKFNLNPSMLAAALMADAVTHLKVWEPWAAENPEYRFEGSFVHLNGATCLAQKLLRSDLVLPDARHRFEAASNDINNYINPTKGVDHWYQATLDSATSLLADDGVCVGVLGRALRRQASQISNNVSVMQQPYAQPSEADIQRRLSQSNAWPEGSSFDWQRLEPGRQPWTEPTFAYVYGRYRSRMFDTAPSDELMHVAAVCYEYVTTTPAATEALVIAPDAPPQLPYDDTQENYDYYQEDALHPGE
ncbi:MAG: hypothetical protein ABI743_09095 [bacterium]